MTDSVGNKFRTLLDQLQKNKTPSVNDVDDAIDQSTELLKSRLAPASCRWSRR